MYERVNVYVMELPCQQWLLLYYYSLIFLVLSYILYVLISKKYLIPLPHCVYIAFIVQIIDSVYNTFMCQRYGGWYYYNVDGGPIARSHVRCSSINTRKSHGGGGGHLGSKETPNNIIRTHNIIYELPCAAMHVWRIRRTYIILLVYNIIYLFYSFNVNGLT